MRQVPKRILRMRITPKQLTLKEDKTERFKNLSLGIWMKMQHNGRASLRSYFPSIATANMIPQNICLLNFSAIETTFCSLTWKLWSWWSIGNWFFSSFFFCLSLCIPYPRRDPWKPSKKIEKAKKKRRRQTTIISINILLERFRSNSSDVFCKKGVLRNFTKFRGKHLCQSVFFDKDAGLRPATLLKKRLWHRCFPVNFVNFLRTPFFIEHLWWLLLEIYVCKVLRNNNRMIVTVKSSFLNE